MRDARYRFSDAVRAATRAAALRMIHAGTVAASPEALGAWIARTDDLHAELTRGGYGSEFTADDLFPLYEAQVAKATAVAPAPAAAGRAKWPRIALIVIGVAVAIGAIAAAAIFAS